MHPEAFETYLVLGRKSKLLFCGRLAAAGLALLGLRRAYAVGDWPLSAALFLAAVALWLAAGVPWRQARSSLPK